MIDGGSVDTPGPVSAGTIAHPNEGIILNVDGSNINEFIQSSSIADNGGVYPSDALLPNSMELVFTNPSAVVQSSQDYILVCT